MRNERTPANECLVGAGKRSMLRVHLLGLIGAILLLAGPAEALMAVGLPLGPSLLVSVAGLLLLAGAIVWLRLGREGAPAE
jgi:hypothetical protein